MGFVLMYCKNWKRCLLDKPFLANNLQVSFKVKLKIDRSLVFVVVAEMSKNRSYQVMCGIRWEIYSVNLIFRSKLYISKNPWFIG